MPATAQVFLEGAYNRSSINNPGKLAQDPELLLHLDRVYQRTWALIARARPDEFAVPSNVAAVGAPAEILLAADTIDVVSVRRAAAPYAEVNVIPASELARKWHLAPAMYRTGLKLVSRALTGDPLNGESFVVSLLDAPAALVALGSSVDPRWPSRHYQLLVDYLACYLSVKDAGRAPEEHTKLLEELKTDGAALVSEYGLPPASIQWIHADVERRTAA